MVNIDVQEVNAELIMNDIQRHIESGVGYIDAIIDYAERHGVEIEVVGEIVRRSPILKAMVHNEAEDLNLIDKTAKLPI